MHFSTAILLFPTALLATERPADTVSQSATVGVVAGVVAAVAGPPVRGAEVHVDGIELAPTDSFGGFIVHLRADMRHHFVIRRLGFAPASFDLSVPSGSTQTVDVPLVPVSTSDVRLPNVRITAKETKPDPGIMGFAHRRATLGGSFLDASAIRERGNPPLSSLLRGMPGVMLIPVTANGTTSYQLQMRGRPTLGSCPVEVFLDGHDVNSSGEDLDRVVASRDLLAVEVYPASAWTPVQFMGPNAACGTVVLWTKRSVGGP